METMSKDDVKCPYCGADNEINHDDGQGLDGELETNQRLTDELIEARAEIERLNATGSVDSILSVTGRYYAVKCDHCGWVGSSEFCIESVCGCAGDCEVFCPFCNRHISDDEPAVKDISKFLNQTVIEKSERKDKLIEQMREALNVLVASATPSGPLWHGSAEMQIARAALSAAERISE